MFVFDPILHNYAPKRPDQANPLPALIAVVLESCVSADPYLAVIPASDKPLRTVYSILEVFLLCLVGWYLAKRKIIDAPTKKILNRLNTSLFSPCLLFNKCAFSLNPKMLAELWIIPVGFVFISTFSALVAYVLGRLFGLKKGQRNFAIACAMFQNSNSLPIALVQSLLKEKLPLSWGKGDSKDAMLGRALSYLVLFSTLGIIVRWSIGVKLVSSAEEGVELQGDETERDEHMRRMEEAEAEEEERLRRVRQEAEEADDEEDLESSTTLRPESSEEENSSASNGIQDLKPKRSILKDSTTSSSAHRRADSSTSTPAKFVLLNESDPDPSTSSTSTSVTLPPSRPGDASAGGLRREPSLRKKKARIFQSFPNTPADSLYGGSRASSVYGNSGYDDDEDLTGLQKVKRTMYNRVWKPIKRFGKGLADFMTVPLWAALLSLVVACIPPLQHTLNQAEPLKAALRSSGSCSVPITLVTLGAYFYTPSDPETTSMIQNSEDTPEPTSHTLRKSFSTQLLDRLRSPFSSPPSRPSTTNPTSTSISEQRASSGATRTVIVSVLSRMIIVPLVLVPLFGYWAYKTVNRADDPVFVVVACLLIGSPTAITLAQITSASSSAAAFERLISRTLFVSYAFLTAPTTIALVLAALFIDKLQNPPQE
ncbi:hypothetical protein JCM11491_001561 [Sporobolomyces phaffii]